MEDYKELIIVVEGTAAMAPYWSTILSNYLEKIIRFCCTNDMTGQKASSSAAPGPRFYLALVMFNARACSGFLIQRSDWTTDVNQFIRLLSTLSFSGGEGHLIATAEGLAEALMMFAIPQNGYQTQQNLDGKRHCILVSASDPNPLATHVFRPAIEIMQQSKINKAQPENSVYDAEDVSTCPIHGAEDVSTWFGQCSVSLSVISPKQLTELKDIYNAANPNKRISEPVVDIKLPHFLVLISDGFSEARAALSRSDLSQRNSSNLIGSPSATWNFSQGTVEVEPGMLQQALGGESVGLNNSASYIPMSQQGNSSNLIGPRSATLNFAQATVDVAPGMQSVGMNNSRSNMAIPNQGSQSKYVKFWEGSLSTKRQGQSVCIPKLEGYRSDKASETLASNWPPTMYIDRFLSQDFMNEQYVSAADFLFFRTMNPHLVLSEMQERKLCAVIRLPSQTLLLSVTNVPLNLIAKLFPGDMFVFKPQIPTQVTTQQHQEQQSQLQQSQQQQQPTTAFAATPLPSTATISISRTATTPADAT